VASDKDGFSVKLLTGAQVASDIIALGIDVRDSDICFKSVVPGEGSNLVKKSTGVHVKEGTEVDLRVRATDHGFEIYFNRKHIFDYEHKVSLGAVSHLYVDGCLELKDVQFGGKFYSVPYETKLHGRLDVGHHLRVSGVPNDKKDSISVDLVSADGDILLTISIRFSGDHSGIVVRNAQLGGVWGQEEREGGKNFPFKRGEMFDLLVENQPYAFDISVNGHKLWTFAHRADPNGISKLDIGGGLVLTALSTGQ
jgi:hypothetical protein